MYHSCGRDGAQIKRRTFWRLAWVPERAKTVSSFIYWAFVHAGPAPLIVPLDCKEIQPVHSKGDQPWYFFGRNDAKAETPVLWPPHAKSWLIGKDSDAVRDWGQEEKGTTEDEMAGCITDSMDVNLSEFRELVMDREAWYAVIHGVARSWTRLSDWTELNWYYKLFLFVFFTLQINISQWEIPKQTHYCFSQFLYIFNP